MGTWGTGIFQNDVADDVRFNYIAKLKFGKTDDQALHEILEKSQDFIHEDNDKFDFWFGLASLMHDYGRITSYVKNTALTLIESNKDLERWEVTDCSQRRKQLEKLKEKLLSEPPERKKISVAKKFICPWKINDVWVYELTSDIFKNTDLYGKYVLILVDELINHDAVVNNLGDILPVVYLKLADFFPINELDVERSIFIPHFSHAQDKEYRFMLYKEGFGKFSKGLVYLGNINFNRIANSTEKYEIISHFYADIGEYVKFFDEQIKKRVK